MLGIDAKAVRIAWSFAVVAAVLAAVVVVRRTILLFVLALVFAYVMYPLMEMSQRLCRSRSCAASMALPVAAMALLFAGTAVLLHRPIKEGESLVREIETTAFREQVAHWKPLDLPVGEFIVEQGPIKAVEALPRLPHGLKRIADDVGNVLLIPILGFFMLIDGSAICNCLLELCFGRGSQASHVRKVVEGILNDAHELICQYVRALLLLCLAVLIVFSVALHVMKVPDALLLAAIACPLEFVPLAGPFIAGITIVAACELSHYPHTMWVVGFLLVYRLFQDYVLSPQLMRKSVQLHPLLILFGILAGAELGNIAGMFLSVPLLALGRLVLYEWRKYMAGKGSASAPNSVSVTAIKVQAKHVLA
jgi:predicted PurR-regulated permease PerM